ncbi:MAG: DUF1398 domain-containing protein [Alsobacter sp.]
MDADRIGIATTCLRAAHDGSMSFPAIVGTLIKAGFEGYAVDYRRNTQTFYQPDGDSVALDVPEHGGAVEAAFNADAVAALVRWAQANGPDYSYSAFSKQAKAAGCAGYLVSFSGRRVVYFGRTAEVHVEHFPS